MALENEELQREMADLTQKMQGLGTASASAAKAQTTLAQKTNAVIGHIDQLASGGGSFKSLNGVIDLTAKAVGGLLSVIPGVGGALKEMAGAVGEAAKFAMAQFDQLAQNYQALGESSAMASDGIDGMQRQFRAIGLVSLPAFAKAINQNAVGLTAFGGSITQGTEEFSKLAGAMTQGDIGTGFLKLGMSFDQIGESTGKFVGTFSRYGLTQGKTFEELKKSTVDYMLEVDQIARLTGQSRKQQEDEQKKNEADVRFRAKLADMRANGQEKEAQELATYVAGLGGAQGEAARALLTGVAMTDQSNKANMLSMDQLRQNTLAVASGQKKAAQGIEDTQKGMAQGAKQYRGLMMTAGESFGGAAIQAFDAEAMVSAREKYIAEGMSATDATKKAQQDLLKNSGKSTEDFTNAQQKVAGINKDMANLTFNSMKAAMGAVDGFAGAIKKVTGFVDEKFGGGKAPSAEGEKKGGIVEGINNFFRGMSGGGAGPAAGGAVQKTQVPADLEKYLKATALIESGGNAQAKAGTSSAAGMFQFINSTWAQTVKEMGKNYTEADRFDPAKATEVMAYFTSKQKSQLEKGTGKEASNVDLYMAHFLGAGGATKFINAMAKNPAMSAASLDPAAAAANKSIYFDKGRERSLQEVYALMGQKMGKAEGAIESGKWGGKDIPQAVAAISSQMGTKTPAGPNSGYAGGQLAAATPQTSLPTNPAQPAPGQADTSFNDKMLALQQTQTAALATIAKNTQQQVDVTKKIQSRQS